MSKEIEIIHTTVETGIGKLDKSIQGLEGTFGQTIDNDNKLDIVTNYNEIKENYDKILTEYVTLFSGNVESTKTSVENLQKRDRDVASDIRLAT